MIKPIRICELKGVEEAYHMKRFWDKVEIKDSSECWTWTAFIDKDGYGLFRMDNKNIRSNRMAYYLFHKVDPCDFVVCHSCDNPTCVNPKHLFLGTHKENIIDCWNKGRKEKTFGTKNGMAKYTEELIQNIVDLWATGQYKHKTEIGRMFGISQSVISEIINGKKWPHIKRNYL